MEENELEDEKSFEEKVLETRYKQRFTIIKLAKQAIDGGDPHQAIRNFEELFDAMAHHHNVKIFDLNPVHITGSQAVAEKLLMSQAFYNMARLMDLKDDEESIKKTQLFLNQFARFTINQPYQSMNTRTLFQHIKKTRFRNKTAFESTYKRIIAESKMCFFANYCFGETHPITNYFRKLKPQLMKSPQGKNFVNLYYNYSGSIIKGLSSNKIVSHLLKNIFFRPFFYFIYLISRAIND